MRNRQVRFVGTFEGLADPIDQLRGGQEPGRLDHAALAVEPHRLDGSEPGLLLGSGQLTMRTPVPSCLTRRLWARIQVRTSALRCQEALSQTSSRGALPSARSRPQHQARNWVVIGLTGRPSTKRSQTCSRQPPPGAADRTSRP